MNVLILGSGGREHALAWKIKQSPHLTRLFVAPGNAGTQELGTNLSISLDDFEAIKEAILSQQVQLVVVGPEAPLVAGLRDYIETDPDLNGVGVIGPGRSGSRLEGSKQFAKEFMHRHNIPTASYKSFTAKQIDEAKTFLSYLTPPYVLKADGLAAGKGVLILEDIEEAKRELDAMLLESKFGEASATVVIEEFLSGVELSCFVLTDGQNYKILPYAKDYKRIGEGDTGLNTGGMGAISPVPFNDQTFQQKIKENIIEPTIQGLQKEEISYIGFIFIGLIRVDSDPYVIEYNVRMGDPETEVVIPRIQSDFLEILEATAKGNLGATDLAIEPDYAVTVMAVSGGYPGRYEKGKSIEGLNKLSTNSVFHAGTKKEEGKVLTNGGRVLAVLGKGQQMEEALQQAYENIKALKFEGMYYRKDIGFDL